MQIQKDNFGDQETPTEVIAMGKTALILNTERKGLAGSSSDDGKGPAPLNFHSPEFNQVDDLNDYSGNLRSFQSLEGIVTADMRHQMERRQDSSTPGTVADDLPALKKIEIELNEPEPVEAILPLTVISRGRTLVIDADAERAIACGRLLQDKGLTCVIMAIKEEATDVSFPRYSELAILEVDDVSITGAFGMFSAIVTAKGVQKKIGEWLEDKTDIFDLVLDLQAVPSYAGKCLPSGYYSPAPDLSDLPAMLSEMPRMRGRFTKPQFTTFLENRCLHGRSRKGECRKCLEICPVGAIQSAGRKVSVNHYFCQGCGGCALVCPTDAIRMIHPSEEELLDRLKRTLESRNDLPGNPPTLIISRPETPEGDGQTGAAPTDDDRIIYFPVEQIGHVGLPLLLGALASGIGSVFVRGEEQDPLSMQKALVQQIAAAHSILQGLGLSPGKIQLAFIPPDEKNDISAFAAVALDAAANFGNYSFVPPAFPLRGDKGTIVRLATQHLYNQSGLQKPILPLSAGSPFGAVAVNAKLCTLCMACAVACPTGALFTPGQAPRLEFVESRCHQCGLCGETCPEGAIELLPRIFCDLQAVEKPALLREVEPFRCAECGAPFATQGMIDRMREKLKGHRMYASDRQLRRLSLCGICRTRDALSTEDASWARL